MEVKTTDEIYKQATSLIRMAEKNLAGQSQKDFLQELVNKKWVSVNDVLEWIDGLRKSNDMWRYPVDECFGILEDAITSYSEPKGSTHNKGYEVNQK